MISLIPINKLNFYKKNNKNTILKHPILFKGNNKDCFEYQYTQSSRQTKNTETQTETFDTFTNLKDKKTLLNKIERLLSSETNNNRIYIAMFDMDNFKSINEILGYKVGDEFITEISKIIKQVTGKAGIEGYRFGGEEFVITASGYDLEKIKELSKKIQEDFKNNQNIVKYSQIYIAKCKKRLNDLLVSNALLSQIKRERIIYDTLQKLAQEDHTLLQNETFKKKTESTLAKIKQLLLDFGSRATKQKEFVFTRNKSDKILENIQKDPDYTEYLIQNENIFDYLEQYEKQDEIQQLKRWIATHNENNGFSATCAILVIEPGTTIKKPAIEYVNTTGEILKKGKNQKKGCIYTQIF